MAGDCSGLRRFSGRQFPAEFVRRYAGTIPDFDEFIAAMNRPISRTFRINTLKSTKERVCSLLDEFELVPLPWFEFGFSVMQGRGLGRTLAHFLGLIYVQEAASMVPPLVLGPRPGERVLDIAAAPGSKTTQMAAMMENRGLLVANDISRERLRGLVGNIDRAGCLNVVVCRCDGMRLARQLAGTFDRVLVDAPCSSEGTMRKSDEALVRWSVVGIRRFSSRQKGLIVAGFDALRPGGELVYSTCTIAPEENEAVIAHLLARRPAACLLPIELAGMRMRPAVQEWEGQRFPPEMVRCRRILPQDNDTEAFFVARIQKAS